MMRDSSSVRLTWALAFGPLVGGCGSGPRGFLPALRWASRLAFLASNSCCSTLCRSRARSSILVLACAMAVRRFSRRAISAGTSSPSLTGRLSLCSASFNSNCTAQLRFDLVGTLPGQRPVLARIGRDLRAVQRDVAQLQALHLARQHLHLYEQRLDLLQETAPKRGNAVVVGLGVCGNEAKRLVALMLMIALLGIFVNIHTYYVDKFYHVLASSQDPSRRVFRCRGKAHSISNFRPRRQLS